MNVLILSKDSTLFSSELEAFGDTRKRHIIYAEALRKKYPRGEIRIIAYAPSREARQTEVVSEGLRIYGTGSFHRATYLLGILKRLPDVLSCGWRPDVVTVQTPWEEGTLGYLLARMLRARYVPQLHFDVFSSEWCAEHWLNPWRRMIAGWLLKHADRIRVVSAGQRERLITQLGIAPEKIGLVPVGVQFQPAAGRKASFRKDIAATLENRRVVLFVGRFYAPKNLHLWVDVAEDVRRRVSDAAFLMAGNGPMFEEIQGLVKKKNLTDRFYLLGNVGHSRLPAIYAAADVFLLSSHYEGFGRVIVESYLSGVPVVSTACVGPMDLIESGITGLLVPCADRQGLADAVVRLLHDDSLRERFGVMGRKKILSRLTLEELSNKLIAFWEGHE